MITDAVILLSPFLPFYIKSRVVDYKSLATLSLSTINHRKPEYLKKTIENHRIANKHVIAQLLIFDLRYYVAVLRLIMDSKIEKFEETGVAAKA